MILKLEKKRKQALPIIYLLNLIFARQRCIYLPIWVGIATITDIYNGGIYTSEYIPTLAFIMTNL